MVRFCVVSSSRTSHFGMKPVRGGRPPSDSRVSIIMMVSVGESVQIVVVSWMVFVFERISA